MSKQTSKSIIFAIFATIAWMYLNAFFVEIPVSIELVLITILVAGVAAAASYATPLRWFSKRSIIGWFMGVGCALVITVFTITVAGTIAWLGLGEATDETVVAVVFSILFVFATPFGLVWIAASTAIWLYFSRTAI
ncbi:MAG: hypothetical protein AAF386_06910 [Pseudomonadota bacterium]